jgi:DNA-binding PadR family transcriptional regulator
MLDLATCACSGRNLDKLVKPAALMLLAGADLHGYDIVRRLTDLPTFKGERPNPAGVYRTLRAMEAEGLITASWELSESGPAKRRYRMTKDGHACVGKWVDTLREYQVAVAGLLALAEQALAAASRGKTSARRTCCASRRTGLPPQR